MLAGADLVSYNFESVRRNLMGVLRIVRNIDSRVADLIKTESDAVKMVEAFDSYEKVALATAELLKFMPLRVNTGGYGDNSFYSIKGDAIYFSVDLEAHINPFQCSNFSLPKNSVPCALLMKAIDENLKSKMYKSACKMRSIEKLKAKYCLLLPERYKASRAQFLEIELQELFRKNIISKTEFDAYSTKYSNRLNEHIEKNSSRLKHHCKKLYSAAFPYEYWAVLTKMLIVK